jgi:hypothetical protein
MRTDIFFMLVLLIGVSCDHCQAAGQKAAAEPNNDNSAAIDQLAKTIFSAADANHNHVLNKHEFENAEEALDEKVRQWGQTGVIGKPKKQNPRGKDKDKDVPAAGGATATGNKLARSNKVSEAEFTFYVQSVVDEADQYWRQMHTASDAQRKAYNAARQAAARGRGRGRMQVPYLPY